MHARVPPLLLPCRCGTAEGLDAGRHCMAKWGFRRVEDIVWIKTNKDRNPRTGYLQPMNQEPYSVLVHTKVRALHSVLVHTKVRETPGGRAPRGAVRA